MVFGFGYQHLDLFVGDLFLAFAAKAEQPQNGAAGDVEHENNGSCDLGEHRHERRGTRGNTLGVSQGDLLRHQFADDQRGIGDDRHDDADTDGVGETRADTGIGQEIGEALAQRSARKSTRQNTHQRDADLDGRQEFAWIGAELQRARRTADMAVDHRLEPRRTGRDDGEFGHCQKAVHAVESDHDSDFSVKHARSIASRLPLRKAAAGVLSKAY